MRSVAKFSLAFLIATSAGTGAAAQTAGSGPGGAAGTRPPIDTTLTRSAGETLATMNQQRLEQRELRTRRARIAEADRVGMERARRLSAMINEGHCHQAYEVALAEHDTVMAGKIAQSCALEGGASVSTPVPVP